ncbi:signal peptidase I [Paludibaculum fermentans]|uniref:signal peptidase I n=1 Tax=Paludibaculum fermentans TaxID=1473598 RepID=UPI001E5EA4B1|nr:signal peptidase I [Paludibaculum fermentans]
MQDDNLSADIQSDPVSPQPIEAAAAIDTPEDHQHGEQPRGAIAEWAVTILLLLFGTTALIQAFVIPTGSMEDNLLIGDHLLVDKLAFAPAGVVSKYILPYTPVKRGDIIVFRYPVDIRQTFVKRVIGVPGDHIKLINKQLVLNGKPMDEPYKFNKTDFIDSYRDNFPTDPNTRVDDRALEMLDKCVVNGEVVVPPDSYFAMGDNRDSSLDSRYWGFVPRANIIGKPLLVYWSYDAPTERLVNSGVDIEHLLDLARHFFTKTRWKRTFMLIRGYDLKN